ncbi:MAG: TIGR04211 family SH3 domain-containing protein [Nitrospiraceae bacterium]|nr:MAG: TIGR04211 family SH3 domain-containing protein [Nitrospiraceae bacterium]
MSITKIQGIHSIIVFTVLSLCSLGIETASSETQYVSDQLIITMREGQGNEFKIIKTLKTGTPLEILEESEQYFKVRTQDGLEGWVLKQYITAETPKTEMIARLEKKRDRLQSQLEQYRRDKGSFQDEIKTVKSDYNARINEINQNLSAKSREAEQTAEELKQVSEKYNALVTQSKNVVELVDERDRLKLQNNSLSTGNERLQKENTRLKRMEMIWWFLAGGGVFFIGWITGKVSRKKRRY